MKFVVAFLAATVLVVAPAQAETVEVHVSCDPVVFNGIGSPPLGDVNTGELVELSFSVDSNNFIDGVPGDVRSYEIDQSSLSLKFSGGVEVGLLDPFPAGQTPYFSLVDGFPVSDGFFVSTSTVSPGGVPLEQDPYNLNLDLGYDGATLSSLNILDALGTYDFDGLTRFGFNLWSIFPDNVNMDIEFVQMTIVPEPGTFALLAPLGIWLLRRRK